MSKKFNKENSQRKEKRASFEKPVPVSFLKTFSSFEAGFKELCLVPGSVSDIVSEYVIVNDMSILNTEELLLNIMKDNLPDPENSKNLFWNLTMSSNRVFLKTGKFIGFGWSIEKTTDENRNTVIKSVTFKVTSYNQMRTIDEIQFLEDNCWQKEM